MNKDALHVAVVDDDDSLSRALGRRLRAAGFVASVFTSAEAFLQNAEPIPFDCLVLDIHLGSMTGLELCRQLTTRGTTTPVIFVTAHDEPEVREEARAVGCSAYFRKPVPGEQLIEAIGNAIGNSSAKSTSL